MRKLLFGFLFTLIPVLAQVDEPAAPWAREAVELLVSKGVFIGYPDGTFRWREPLSRQEAALALYRLLAAYGVDKLSPQEVQKLLEATRELQKELESQDKALEQLRSEKKALEDHLRALENQPRTDTRPLEEALKNLQERIQGLEEAQKGLRAALSALEGRALEDGLKGLQESLRTLENRLKSLESRPQADPSQVEVLRREQEALKAAQQALGERLQDLERARTAQEETLRGLANELKGLPEARKLAEEAQARLQSLEPRTRALEEGLQAQKERLATLEERLKALETRQAQHDARLKALEEEVVALKRTLTPFRLPLYLGLAAYRGDVTGEWYSRLMLGHDALLGPLGLRLAYEAPIFQPDRGLGSLDLTFRASYGDLDGYFGVGGGIYLDQTPFGQLLIGVGVRLVPSLSIFLEGHQRYLFDGQASQRSTLAFGLATRF